MAVKKDIYKKIVTNLHDGLFFIDQDKIITFWNNAAEKITGFPKEEVLGKKFSDCFISHYDINNNLINNARSPVEKTISDGTPREADLFIIHKKGYKIPVSIRVSTIKDNSNSIIGAIELFTDISSKSVNEIRIKELEKLALIDNLTQLANRHYIEREMKSRFEEKKRFNIPFGILFADIDNFKEFNDNYGHITGDEVLKKVSNIFITNSRPFDLFGRWGGEEFIGIIRNISGENLIHLGEKMRGLIETADLAYEGEKLKITVSIGATLVKREDNLKSLIHRADNLLYQSKNNGKNRLTSDTDI